MKQRKPFIILGIVALIAVLSWVWFDTLPEKEPIATSDDELMDFEAEEIPLGPPSTDIKEFNTGYGITWIGVVSDITHFTTENEYAELTVIGNSEVDPVLTGITRETAEELLGSPLTRYNNKRIPVYNDSYKNYYKLDDSLIILYLDKTQGEKVIFAVRMDGSLASTSNFFTSKQLSPYVAEDFERMTLELINAIRQVNGKSVLAYDDLVAEVSRMHSQSMADDNYFAHVDGAGRTPKDRLNMAGVQFRNYGETLTAATWTPMDVVTIWMNSPAHRDIILGDFDAGGVGIATGNSTYGIYVTLNVIDQ